MTCKPVLSPVNKQKDVNNVKSTKKLEDFHILFTLVFSSIHDDNTEIKIMQFYPIEKD